MDERIKCISLSSFYTYISRMSSYYDNFQTNFCEDLLDTSWFVLNLKISVTVCSHFLRDNT